MSLLMNESEETLFELKYLEGISELLKHIEYWREAPVWTPDTIADATQDWFKYLG